MLDSHDSHVQLPQDASNCMTSSTRRPGVKKGRAMAGGHYMTPTQTMNYYTGNPSKLPYPRKTGFHLMTLHGQDGWWKMDEGTDAWEKNSRYMESWSFGWLFFCCCFCFFIVSLSISVYESWLFHEIYIIVSSGIGRRRFAKKTAEKLLWSNCWKLNSLPPFTHSCLHCVGR